MTGTLYSTRKLTLVFSTYTCNASWQYFALIVGEAVKCIYIFVVDVFDADFSKRALLVSQLAFAWMGWILKHWVFRGKGVAV
jgi:hypothetical protein